MKHFSFLCFIITFSAPTLAFVSNPFTGSFQTPNQASNIPVAGSFPNFTSANISQQQNVTNTFQTPAPVQVQVQAPVTNSLPSYNTPTTSAFTNSAHIHTAPAYNPPIPSASLTHSHGPQNPVAPRPAPGFPHMHSGHPNIAPAVASQNMTYQQIIEYLVNTNGIGLANAINRGSGNLMTQCKAYCDALPPAPTCDEHQILYRNKCEADCIHRTTSESNLRYGMCCCSDDDFDYSIEGNMFIVRSSIANPRQNFCVSRCIFNCLGGETSIESEHTDVELEVAQSTLLCSNVI